MNDSQAPIELDSVKEANQRKRGSRAPAMLISVLMGGVSAFAIFYVLKQTIHSDAPQTETQSVVARPVAESDSEFDDVEINSREKSEPQAPRNEIPTLESAAMVDSEPLSAPRVEVIANSNDSPRREKTDSLPKFPASVVTVNDEPLPETTNPEAANTTGADSTPNSSEKEDETQRKEPKLSTRKWTTLVLLNPQMKGEAAIPDDAPIWNYEKGYSFTGSKLDQHRLGGFLIDGEFIIRDGYLRREFGNTALLHLPSAEDFELEGIVHLEGSGGWLMLLGWDFEKKSGYVIYNTKLRVSGSMWFVIEIADGNPVANSERLLVKRDAQGEGALRVLVEKKKVSMQAADAYLFKDEELPNYKPGHVAIGTFSPQYGPQNIGIKSLRMKLR